MSEIGPAAGCRLHQDVGSAMVHQDVGDGKVQRDVGDRFQQDVGDGTCTMWVMGPPGRRRWDLHDAGDGSRMSEMG